MAPFRRALTALTLVVSVCAERTAIADGQMTLGGKPFFPWGVYMQEATDDELAQVAKFGFNTIISYEHGPKGLPVDGSISGGRLPTVKRFLDRAAAHGLQVFFAINGFYSFPPYNEPRGTNWTMDIVSTFRSHPALAGWYTVDERPAQYLPQIKARRDLIRKLDPEHLAYMVLDTPADIPQFVHAGVAEIAGVDTYPWKGSADSNLTKVVDAWSPLMAALEGLSDRTSVCVPQAFGWQNYYGNSSETAPPAAAIRAMAYAALALGCRGLIMYSYYDLFQTTSPRDAPYANRTRAPAEVIAARLLEFGLLGREIRSLEPLLLGGQVERLPLPAQPPGVVGGRRCPGGTPRHATEECTLILANLTPQPHTVRLGAAGGGVSVQLGPYGVSVTSGPRNEVLDRMPSASLLAPSATYRTPPAFSSTYLTLYNFTRAFSADRWLAELRAMRALNISEIIIGSTANVNWCDDVCTAQNNVALAYFPTKIPRIASGPPLVERVLSAADDVGIKVTLGLYIGGFNHSAWFLQSLARVNKAMATELYGLYGTRYRSFAGFHAPMELKNCVNCSQRGWDGQINFNTPELRQRLLETYVNPICDHVKSLSPSLPVGMPPSFFDKNSFLGRVNGTWMEPGPWGEWMEAFLLQAPNLSRFTYQDCVGSSLFSYPFADTVAYFRALRTAVDRANERRATRFLFWSDLEAFEFLQDYWVPASAQTRRPAAASRLAGQLAAEAPLVDGFTFYEWLFYMSPSGAPQLGYAKGDIPRQTINSNASLHNYLEYSRYLGMGAPPPAPPAPGHRPPWSLELVSTGWAYTLSRPPTTPTNLPKVLNNGDKGKLTAAGALLAPGPLASMSESWRGEEPIRVTLPSPPHELQPTSFRAFCALDTTSGASLPTVDAYLAGAHLGKLTTARAEDGVVSVFSLLLDHPTLLRPGDSVTFVLTPPQLGAGTKTMCARVEVYA
jgi:hypothetical protein